VHTSQRCREIALDGVDEGPVGFRRIQLRYRIRQYQQSALKQHTPLPSITGLARHGPGYPGRGRSTVGNHRKYQVTLTGVFVRHGDAPWRFFPTHSLRNARTVGQSQRPRAVAVGFGSVRRSACPDAGCMISRAASGSSTISDNVQFSGQVLLRADENTENRQFGQRDLHSRDSIVKDIISTTLSHYPPLAGPLAPLIALKQPQARSASFPRGLPLASRAWYSTLAHPTRWMRSAVRSSCSASKPWAETGESSGRMLVR